MFRVRDHSLLTEVRTVRDLTRDAAVVDYELRFVANKMITPNLNQSPCLLPPYWFVLKQN
jgi:hypothetical protein